MTEEQVQRLGGALQDQERTVLELRRELALAREAAAPRLMQVQQLLLDPGVHREFAQMKEEITQARNRIKVLQEEVDTLKYR